MSTSNSDSTLASAPSVPLNRPHVEPNSGIKVPVWPLNESIAPELTPLPSKCGRNDRAGGICCKDLKDDDDRTLIDPDVVRDM
jgi:vacuolar iron transporter family protein